MSSPASMAVLITSALRAISLDLSLGWKRLRRRPGVLVLFALAIGPATGALCGMLQLANAAFFQAPAGVALPDQIHRWVVHERDPRGEQTTRAVMSLAEVSAVQSATGGSLTIAFTEADPVPLAGGGGRPIRVSAVTPNYFAVLGVKPLVGTFAGFGAGPGSSHIVLSNELWRSLFHGSREALGASVRLNGQVYTVTAIAPAGFRGVGLRAADAWVGTDQFLAGLMGFDWRTTFIFAAVTRVGSPELGRVLQSRARVGLADLAGRRDAQRGLDLVPLSAARLTEGGSPAQLALLLLVVTVLATTFATLTGGALLLARVTECRRETALVTALGASAARVVVQITGGLTLSGGAAVVLAAIVQVSTLRAGERMLLPRLDVLQSPSAGGATVTLALGVALVLVVSWIVAVLSTRREEILPALNGGAVTDRRAARAHGWLICAQGGLAFTFAGLSLLFLHSLRQIGALPLGIRPDQFAFAEVSPENSPAAVVLARRIESRVATVPGVARTALASAVPLFSSNMTMVLTPSGPAPAYVNAVDPGYFAVAGTRILRGREFTPDDRYGAPPVAIVNTALASTYWPSESALGKCVYVAPPPYTCYQVVGVADSWRTLRLTGPAPPQFYVPQLQNRAPGPLFVLVRFSAARVPLDSLDRAASQAGGVAPDFRFRTLDAYIEPQLRPWRLGALLTSTIAALTLLSAALAVYAVARRAVDQRARELALRHALGARAARLAGGVVAWVSGLAGIGVATALPLAIAAAAKVGPLLYATSPLDARVWLAAALAVQSAALLAAVPPALRAAGPDPATVMRA